MTESGLERPAVTVAAVVEDGGRFLLVRERTREGLRLNQPAGHVEIGESIVAAAARETLEESGWRVEPYALVGIYRWEAPDNGATFVRFAFAARPVGARVSAVLDDEIVEALWLDYATIASLHAEHRSPLVLRSIDDFVAGRRYPLDLVADLPRVRMT